MPSAQIPWRGPGGDRPDLPLPPARMPLWRDGRPRKRWRYVGAFADELMLCAARAEIGPFTQTFWILWDRERRQHRAHASMRPGAGEVRFDGPRIEIDGPGLRASLRLGQTLPIETVCPSGASWAWTRKRVGVPVEGWVEVPGSRRPISARGVDDESAGYHQRHTHWHWSAGVGRDAAGRRLAWNLVAGVNDPPRHSERAIWIDGEPVEPGPARFRGLEGIDLAGGDHLEFSPESAHARDENLLFVRSRYRHRFGTFTGTLAGQPLSEGLGVMERHDAVW